jgi:hypothetical protein
VADLSPFVRVWILYWASPSWILSHCQGKRSSFFSTCKKPSFALVLPRYGSQPSFSLSFASFREIYSERVFLNFKLFSELSPVSNPAKSMEFKTLGQYYLENLFWSQIWLCVWVLRLPF